MSRPRPAINKFFSCSSLRLVLHNFCFFGREDGKLKKELGGKLKKEVGVKLKKETQRGEASQASFDTFFQKANCTKN